MEDDDSAFQLIQLGFSEAGGDFRLYWVEDGEQALKFLRRSGGYVNAPKPDLILLNLNLPRISGDQALEIMKADPSLSDIPAVVFSSSRLDKDRARCLALGARSFITKPADLQEFIDAIRNVCSLAH